MSEWTLGAVLDTIAEVIPDRPITVCGDRRRTFAAAADHTRRLANFLAGSGFGVRRERGLLQNWECGQDRVALVMHNDLYAEMVIGCLKARTVPVNVNYNYTPREVQELLEYVRPRAVIYHKSLGAKFADVFPPDSADLLVSVDDGSTASELPGAVSLNDALAQGDMNQDVVASPDDLLMICTGGTTGRPKGVLWRQSDIYVSSMVGADHACAQEIHDKVRRAGAPWFAVSPLMHAAGMWTAFSAIMAGLTVVLYDTSNKLDPRSVWQTAEREKVGLMTMVGDAYAAPLVEELRRGRYDLSSLNAIGTGGAATNPKYQRALLELLPHITLINGYGSSETGNMGFGNSRRDTRTDTFNLREGGLVLSEDYSHFLRPGEHGVGWAARTGRIPLGYFDDPDATHKTFPEVDGKRVVISGDRATLEEDGTLRLYGRDSLVVNTGGEKV
ncbi:MAG: AMP-binding protein, partial [Mycobacterium sp.]|nr:AMP-binding protein [Mycobacterium sp.]